MKENSTLLDTERVDTWQLLDDRSLTTGLGIYALSPLRITFIKMQRRQVGETKTQESKPEGLSHQGRNLDLFHGEPARCRYCCWLWPVYERILRSSSIPDQRVPAAVKLLMGFSIDGRGIKDHGRQILSPSEGDRKPFLGWISTVMVSSVAFQKMRIRFPWISSLFHITAKSRRRQKDKGREELRLISKLLVSLR